MPKYLLTVFLIITSFTLRAQTWEIGLSAGGAGYMGDLNPHNPLKLSGVSLGGFIKRNFNGYLALKGNLNYGVIHAADSNSNNAQFVKRNLSFTTKIIEPSLIAEFNFMHYIPDAGKNKFTPFVFAGFGGALYFNSTKYNNRTFDLRNARTEGQSSPYSKILLSVPYGAGIKYNIGGKWNLIADLGYRRTNTDYLDDVSGYYADPSQLTASGRTLGDRSGEVGNRVATGVPGTQRGDLRPRDTYLFLNVSISFTFVTQRCYFESR